jgi:hypothetical protein
MFSGGHAAVVTPNRYVTSRVSSIGEANRRRPIYPIDDRYRRPYVPVYGIGYPYSVVGWLGPGCVGVLECDPLADSEYDSQVAAPAGAQEYPSPDYGPGPVEQAEAAPAESFRPEYVRPQPAPELEPEAPVTLIFKDGRPSEQIQNYMLTRTTLYVQEKHLREIPVDQLDLPATAKVNKDAGVDFQLPGRAN